MIKSSTLSIVIIMILILGFSIQAQQSNVPNQVNNSSMSQQDIPNECLPNNEWANYLRTWRIQYLEPLIRMQPTTYYTELSSPQDISYRSNPLNFLDQIAQYDDIKRQNICQRMGIKNGVSGLITLLNCYHEAILVQDCLYQIHMSWLNNIGNNSSKIIQIKDSQNRLQQYQIFQFDQRYILFCQNSGLKLENFPNEPQFYEIPQFYNVSKQILSRREHFIQCYEKLLKDLEDQNKNVNGNILQLQEEIKRLNNLLLQQQQKMQPVPVQDNIITKIKDIQLKGQGNLEIDINGEKFVFTYICPGTYYYGIENGEQASYMRQLSGNNLLQVGMLTINLKSGFFIMQDKLSSQQLHAINAQYQVAPNQLTWLQANESASIASTQLKNWGITIRLPSEIEWSCAARGKDSKKLFPWGNDNPQCPPEKDITELQLKNMGSVHAEWCIDIYETYSLPVNIDSSKPVNYDPIGNGISPVCEFFIRDAPTVQQRKYIVISSENTNSSKRAYRGASTKDYDKSLFANRAIPMRRSNRSDVVNELISFRFVLIPPKN